MMEMYKTKRKSYNFNILFARFIAAIRIIIFQKAFIFMTVKCQYN
jgi:hypothetical protein